MQNLKNFITIIFLLLANFAYSQYAVGFKVGGGTSNGLGEDFPSTNKSKYGIDLALFYEYELNPSISVATELNFNQKGCEYEFIPIRTTHVFVDFRNNYLSIPILVKMYFGQNADFYLYGGVSYDKVIQSKLSHHANDGDFKVESSIYCKHELQDEDASLNLGFGLHRKNIFLDFKCQIGLTNVYEGKDAPTVRNRYFGFTLGYILLKKKVSRCITP